MALKYFTKDRYRSLGEVLAAIKAELNSLTPKDSDGIKWSRGADGMTANLVSETAAEGATQTVEDTEPSQGIDEYNGYFKIVDKTEYSDSGSETRYRIGVINGNDTVLLHPQLNVPVSSVYINGISYYVPDASYDIDKGKRYAIALIVINNASQPMLHIYVQNAAEDDNLLQLAIWHQLIGYVEVIDGVVDIRQMYLKGLLSISTSAYTGDFTACVDMQYTTSETLIAKHLMVVNGHDPRSTYSAGSIDVGGVGVVAPLKVDMPTTDVCIYLTVTYKDGVYTPKYDIFEIGKNDFPENSMHIQIAILQYVNGFPKITQTWTGGGVAFRQWYWI